MKNSTTTQIILKALDINLKVMLAEDLKAFNVARQNKRRAALQLVAA